MKVTVKQITITAILLAICIISQFFKNLSVYITGPIINTCIILAVLTVGLGCGIILSIITPITAFVITGSPVMQAIPLIIPCIIMGNIMMVLSFNFVYEHFKKKQKDMIIITLMLGSVLKSLFMTVVISLLILPNMLPEKLMSKLTVFRATFSITQLIAALIGSFYVYVIWKVLKKIIKDI